jgi:hypothetical protein
MSVVFFKGDVFISKMFLSFSKSEKFLFFSFVLMSNMHSNNLPTKEQLFACLERKLQQSTMLNTVLSLMN